VAFEITLCTNVMKMISDNFDKNNIAQFLVPALSALCLMPFVSPAVALIGGIFVALWLGNPYPTKNFSSKLLSWSVVGLGAGMNLETVAKAGLQGLGYTMISILLVFFFGILLMKFFKVEEEVGMLVTVGTAICGGSAIAAVAPVIQAKTHSISVALATVFILNAMALILFPPLGHYLQMSDSAFGLWSALAIHDTSSVVGATMSYSSKAAEIGTTIKLARALWIVPLVFVISYFYAKRKSLPDSEPIKKPWFILGFLMMAALVTWVPFLQPVGEGVEWLARRTLVLALFFIGLSLSKESLQQVGLRPLMMGIALWVLVLIATLAAVLTGLIHTN
jgi:uncharacterized integral membrane protein (TIGR00698 family)